MKTGLMVQKTTEVGVDMAGVVESVGKDVTEFKPGDEVFGTCRGAFAEYGAASSKKIAKKPANISFEEAAAVPVGAITALQGLRDKGKLQPGQKVLINGAGGGVGSYAVQLAKYLDGEVTAVCSTGKIDLVRSLGADHVIDYTKEDFTKNGQKYDLIVAVSGAVPFSAYKRALTPDGTLVVAGSTKKGLISRMLKGLMISKLGGKWVVMFIAEMRTVDLNFLAELLETGKLKSVIDSTYPLSEVREAMRRLEEWHASGRIVLKIAD
jgi:NADPH:quinone reductase-like Zn-dependent oxidoreductase